MTRNDDRVWSKVPEVTLIFWIIKIAATTLGETGGDMVSMSMNWGYLASWNNTGSHSPFQRVWIDDTKKT